MGTVISTRENVFPHSMLRAERHMATQIAKYTNGEVILEVLQAGSGNMSPRDMAAMVGEGDVIQAANLNAFFFPKVPELLIQSIPFLFTGDEHARRFPTSEPARWMAEKVEDAYDVKMLGYLLVASHVAVNGVDPVRNLSDFTGKILKGSRGTNSMFENVKPLRFEQMGFAAAARGELATSDIEIAVGLLQNNYNQQVHKRFKHTTLVHNYYNIYYTPILNKDIWNGLSDSQRAGINAAMRDTENAAVSYQHDSTVWAWQLGESNGVQMHMQTDAERQEWKAEFYPIIRELAQSNSSDPEETSAMIDAIEDLVKDLEWR
jgi:TRAP-type C4-dicarboxylate transport system substrate-binding protein